MNPFDLQVLSKREASPAACAKGFLEHFASGRLANAGAMAADDFRWFGNALSRDAWESDFTRRFVREASMRFDTYRDVPPALVEALAREADALFGGPIGQDQHVVLADGVRGDSAFTVAVVVTTNASRLVVSRVFDPAPLAARIIELTTEPEHLG